MLQNVAKRCIRGGEFSPRLPNAASSPPTNQTELWLINTVTDAYGQTLTCTYTEEAGSRWCITRINLPNGQHLTYNYGTTGTDTSTGGHFYGLTSVNLPDGTTSTISSTYETASQCMKFSIFDAAADPMHRSKTVYLTTLSWTNPTTGA